MALLACILILTVWAIIKIKEALTPTTPPFGDSDDIKKMVREIQSLPTKKERRKYLRDKAKRR